MNQQELSAVQRAFDQTIAKHRDLHRAELAGLRAELAAVRELAEKTFADVHVGVWREGMQMLRGQACTHGGSTWICRKDSREKPGECGDHELICKRGRDGRDAASLMREPRSNGRAPEERTT